MCLTESGELEQVFPLRVEQQRGKKTVFVPPELTVPAPVKRSSGISANFLCDNATYLLGMDQKEKPQRALDCFAACRALHEKLLQETDTPAARAVLAFFRTWQPEKAKEHNLRTQVPL